MTEDRCPSITLLVVSLVWGSTWLANSVIAAQDSPLRLLCARYLYASVILGAAVLISRIVRQRRRIFRDPARADPDSTGTRETNHPTLPPDPPNAHAEPQSRRKQIGVSLTLGVTMFAAPSLLLVWSAHHGSGAWTPLIYAALPLALTLAAGELRIPAIIGLGAMLALLNGSLSLDPLKLLWTLPLIAAATLQGWSLFYARRHLAVVATLQSVMIQCIVATWLLFGAALLSSEPRLPPLLSWSPASLTALLLLAALATAAAYPLYYRLLRHFDPAQLTTSEWLQTTVAIAESAWLLRQRPGWLMGGAPITLLTCTFLILHQQRDVPGFRLT